MALTIKSNNMKTIEKTNNITYRTSKTVNGKDVNVKIRLNDECKNGHQDFAITGEVYQKGKPKIDKYLSSAGCCHNEILEAFPEFQIFVNLHLCDYNGVPMHPTENGFYHLHNGFNRTPVESKDFKKEYCKYYRITSTQFDKLKECENKVQFGLTLEKLNILDQWQKEAKKAIKMLEKLSGKKFVNDSVKSQYIAPTEAERKEEAKRIKEGYYTPEAKAKREKAKQDKELKELENDLKKELDKHKLEFKVKKEVLLKGGSKALDNCIFYNHSLTLAFNWRNSNNLDTSFIYRLMGKLNLPEGVKVKNKDTNEVLQ